MEVEQSESAVVKVWVRKEHDGPDGFRRIAVRALPEIPQAVWFAQGYAFDGNQVIRTVAVNDLAGVEQVLIDMLAGYGYRTEFV